mmetsp:Transcript_24245/g.75444  ORF Transcript_24245/g.75444 Transcript_24245/m.75444 type:complete len:429 (+) Transcript_24245:85-1371(+)
MTALTNSKTELVQFLQRFIGRTLAKGDVAYTTVPLGEQFQVTVRLNCHQGEEFAGEICASEKDAQQSAAAQALQAFSAEIAALPPKEKSKAGKATEVPGTLAALGLTANFKTDLVQKMQIHIKRTLVKADIAYETAKIGEQFQSSVRLDCAGGQEFTGEVSATEKIAEHSAAQQAVMNQHLWGPGTAAPVVVAAPGNKRKAPDTSHNPKSELVTFLQRMIKRTMLKDDITYEVAQTVGGYQATVTTPCFEGRQFAGEVCTNQKLAEGAAAYQAHVALAAEFGQQPPVKRLRTNAAGATPGASQLGGKPVVVKKTVGGFAGGAMAKGAGAGTAKLAGGKGGGGGFKAETREILELNTGEVIEWNENGSFGWIRPDSMVNHPEAHKRGGKIYVHKKDVVPPGSPVGTGSTVQFKVYSDSKGLGACEVTPM